MKSLILLTAPGLFVAPMPKAPPVLPVAALTIVAAPLPALLQPSLMQAASLIPVQGALPVLEQTAAHLAAPATGDSNARREFLDRLFGVTAVNGEESAEPVPVSESAAADLAAVKADVERFKTYVAALKPGLRSGKTHASALIKRVQRVAALGGIPRKMPNGWFKTMIVVEPLRPELLALLPEFAGVIRVIAGSSRFNGDVAYFLYAFNTLTQRQHSLEKLEGEIRWLYGTYHLPSGL